MCWRNCQKNYYTHNLCTRCQLFWNHSGFTVLQLKSSCMVHSTDLYKKYWYHGYNFWRGCWIGFIFGIKYCCYKIHVNFDLVYKKQHFGWVVSLFFLNIVSASREQHIITYSAIYHFFSSIFAPCITTSKDLWFP